MKTTEQNKASANLHNSGGRQPFFQKEGEGQFFSDQSSAVFSNGTGDGTLPFFSKSSVQPQLTVGQPGDSYERDADATADAVVQTLVGQNTDAIQAASNTSASPLPIMPIQRQTPEEAPEEQIQEKKQEAPKRPIFESEGAPPEEAVQRKCTACAAVEKEQAMAPEVQPSIHLKEKKGRVRVQRKCAASEMPQLSPQHLQRRGGSSHAGPGLESRLNASRGGGNPLPEETRGSMESAFGADFSGVRVHTDSSSVQMNQELGAQAFTNGSDIYFNAGKYDTQSSGGQHLLAHELMHVVQQGGGQVKETMQAAGLPVNDDPGLEKEADDKAGEVMQMKTAAPREDTLPEGIQKMGCEPGCSCPACSEKAAQRKGKESAQVASVQMKGHGKGCGCSECSKPARPEKAGGKGSQVQRKQAPNSLVQLKPRGVVSYSFLGERVRGGVHKRLKSRLELVEAELKRQYVALPATFFGFPTGKPATLKEYAGLDTISGYQKRKGNHGKGKAVDVNYWNQPYIATRTPEGSRTTFGGEQGGATKKTRAYRQPAVEVYDRAVSFVHMGGDSADVANRRRGESAQKAYRRFRKTSDALKTYFSLAFHSNYDKVTRPPIADPEAASEADLLKIPLTERKDETAAIARIKSIMNSFAWKILHLNHSLTPREQYFRILRDYEIVRKPMQRGKPTRPKSYRNPAKGFLHMPEHFVVAMMDVGKLRWGACEFSARSNGDVHHFDLSTPHRMQQPAPLPSGLGSGPAKNLWKVDRKAFPPNVEKLGFGSWLFAHMSFTVPPGVYEMFAHPIVKSGDTYLKVYDKEGSIRFWPTNEYDLVEMPDKLGKRGGKKVLGGRITNYSPDDVETVEGDRYMSPQAAAALINTMGRFQLAHRGAGLEMGDASTSKGRSPRLKAGGSKRHGTHYQGNAFDAHYLDAQGQSQHIGAGAFDTDANFEFIRAAIEEGYRYVIVGRKRVFKPLYKKLRALRKTYKGLKVSRNNDHNDHMHLSFDVKVSKSKKKKVKKSRAFEKRWSPILRILGVDPDDIFVPFQRKPKNSGSVATLPTGNASSMTKKESLAYRTTVHNGLAPAVQLSPISQKIDKQWKTSQDREAILHLLSKDDAFASRADVDIQKSLAAIFKDPNDLWLARKVLNRQLGESKGRYKKKPLKLPIELFFFKGKSSEKALVIAGVHGSEKQGIEVALMLKKDLAAKQPHYNVILVPSLFPVNAKSRTREGSNKTNRNFPEKGKTLAQAKTDRKGRPLDADGDKILIENQLLIQLIERYQPSRIISIHGTRYAHQAGVFSDPITQEPDYAYLRKEAAALAAYMLTQVNEGDPRSLGPYELQKLTRLMYQYMLDAKKRENEAQTKRDESLAIKTAKAIAKDTKSLASLKGRHKAADIVKKVKSKFKRKPSEVKAAIENLKQNPAVAGNKLDQTTKSPEWAGKTPEGISLGGYAPSHGISVFTVEPGINLESSKYPKRSKKYDPGVKQADRVAELQAYADAIRTILLGK